MTALFDNLRRAVRGWIRRLGGVAFDEADVDRAFSSEVAGLR